MADAEREMAETENGKQRMTEADRKLQRGMLKREMMRQKMSKRSGREMAEWQRWQNGSDNEMVVMAELQRWQNGTDSRMAEMIEWQNGRIIKW